MGNAVFGARFKGLSLYFLYQKGNLIRIKTGLDTYLIRIQTRTPPSRYPPLMIIPICLGGGVWGDAKPWGRPLPEQIFCGFSFLSPGFLSDFSTRERGQTVKN